MYDYNIIQMKRKKSMVRVVSPSSRSSHRRNERYCAFIKNPSKRSCIVASSAVKELPFDRVAPSGVKEHPFDRVAPSGELPVR